MALCLVYINAYEQHRQELSSQSLKNENVILDGELTTSKLCPMFKYFADPRTIIKSMTKRDSLKVSFDWLTLIRQMLQMKGVKVKVQANILKLRQIYKLESKQYKFEYLSKHEEQWNESLKNGTLSKELLEVYNSKVLFDLDLEANDRFRQLAFKFKNLTNENAAKLLKNAEGFRNEAMDQFGK